MSFFGATVPIFCYHQVRPQSGMTPEKFGCHLDFLKMLGFSSIRLDELYRYYAQGTRPTFQAVVLTFDDCTLDNWLYAVPELEKRGMTGVFFAITDFVGSEDKVRPPQGHSIEVAEYGQIMGKAIQGDCSGFMNRAEIQALVADYGMEVYAHTATHQACFRDRSLSIGQLGEKLHWSHPWLCGPQASVSTSVFVHGSAYAHSGWGFSWQGDPLDIVEDKQRLDFCLKEFSHSKAFLEKLLGQPCPFFCFPWGEYDSLSLEAARLAGFQAVLTLDQRVRQEEGVLPMFGRIAVRDRKSLFWLFRKLWLFSKQKF